MNISPSLLNNALMPTHDAASNERLQAGSDLDAAKKPTANDEAEKVKDAFNTFMGETFYSHMLKAMRSTVDKPAYFHGGRGEEAFQSQLDQMFAQEMSEATSEQLAKPMFDLFQLNLHNR